MSKNNKTIGIGVIFIVIVVVGVAFAYLNQGTPAIKLSCNETKILGFAKYSTIFEGYQTVICQVDLKVSYNNTVICSGKSNILNYETGVVPCSDLTNFKGKNISISANFYDTNGTNIGQDSKEIVFQPS